MVQRQVGDRHVEGGKEIIEIHIVFALFQSKAGGNADNLEELAAADGSPANFTDSCICQDIGIVHVGTFTPSTGRRLSSSALLNLTRCGWQKTIQPPPGPDFDFHRNP